MGQRQSGGNKEVDLEAGEILLEKLPNHLICRNQLLMLIDEWRGAEKTWEGLLVDPSLDFIEYDKGTIRSEIQDLNAELSYLVYSSSLLATQIDDEIIFDQERNLRERFNIYTFRVKKLSKWLKKSPHKRLFMILISLTKNMTSYTLT